MNARLTRSRTDAILGGVCGGLGRYLGIDPTLVRLFFVVLLFTSGFGFLLYMVLWIVLPQENEPAGQSIDFGDRARQMGVEFGEVVRRPNPNAAKYIGFGLIVAGLLFLLDNLNLPWLRWMDSDLIWPVLLIIGGGVLLWRALQSRQ